MLVCWFYFCVCEWRLCEKINNSKIIIIKCNEEEVLFGYIGSSKIIVVNFFFSLCNLY